MHSSLKGSLDERMDAFTGRYLEILRGSGEPIPRRQDLTMKNVAAFAADMTIIEIVNDAEWIIRLSGTSHCKRANSNRTGRNVLEGKLQEERNIRKAVIDNMLAFPCGAKTTWREHFGNDMKASTLSVSFPALGKLGEVLIVSYELLTGEIEWHGLDHPTELASVDFVSHNYIDIGNGIPS